MTSERYRHREVMVKPGEMASTWPPKEKAILLPRTRGPARETVPIPPLLTAAIKTNALTLLPAAHSLVLLLRCALLLHFMDLAFLLSPLCRRIHRMTS
jgi:hypothetical protein